MTDHKQNSQSNQNQSQKQDQNQQGTSQEQGLLNKLEQLSAEVDQAHEREKRALADYQNLVRRTQQERSKLVRMASRDVIETLLPALENLDRATEQLDDQGLSMVVEQIWNQLKEFGLEKIKALGNKFDLESMEVVDRVNDGETVVEVVSPGYKLKNKVIQHAKVILGNQKNKN